MRVIQPWLEANSHLPNKWFSAQILVWPIQISTWARVKIHPPGKWFSVQFASSNDTARREALNRNCTHACLDLPMCLPRPFLMVGWWGLMKSGATNADEVEVEEEDEGSVVTAK